MYANTYLDASTFADQIIASARDTSPEGSDASRSAYKGLARRRVEDMKGAMQQVSEITSPATAEKAKPYSAAESMANYIASIRKDKAALLDMEGSTGGVGSDTVGNNPYPLSRSKGSPVKDAGNRLMKDLMKDYKLSKEQAAGIVGNLDYETGGFKFMQELSPVVKGSRGGFGFAQWTGDRRREFDSYVSANKLDPQSYEANYGFLKHEFDNTREGSVLDKLRATSNAGSAAAIFSNEFLRPATETANVPRRSFRANRYVEEYIPDSYKGR